MINRRFFTISKKCTIDDYMELITLQVIIKACLGGIFFMQQYLFVFFDKCLLFTFIGKSIFRSSNNSQLLFRCMLPPHFEILIQFRLGLPFSLSGRTCAKINRSQSNFQSKCYSCTKSVMISPSDYQRI